MLSDDLLHQAYHLAAVDQTKPKQANLRRAVSAAYYALFHRLTSDCVKRISPRLPANLSPRIARVFLHAEMKQVCKSIAAGNPSEVLQELRPTGFSAELRNVARVFVLLQDARHSADYDVAKLYTRTETIKLLDEVQNTFREWRSIKANDEASVFLAALLFANRWAK